VICVSSVQEGEREKECVSKCESVLYVFICICVRACVVLPCCGGREGGREGGWEGGRNTECVCSYV